LRGLSLESLQKKINVEQPPSAVPLNKELVRKAKSAKSEYRRTLPHLQVEDKPLFVTFTTYRRWQLPDSVRHLVLKHCLHDNGIKL
jgi:hypothetical protein